MEIPLCHAGQGVSNEAVKEASHKGAMLCHSFKEKK